MRVRYLFVTVGLGLAALAALMMITGGPVAAQDPTGAQGDPSPQPHNGITCHATVDGSGTVHSDSTSQAVRAAVADAVDGDLVKVSGYCRGTAPFQGVMATVYISTNITLRGGYSTDWTYDPDAYPTTLDAAHAGRVVVISATNGATLDSLHIVSGTALADLYGGGIYVTNGAAATISHSTVFSNSAGYGGGICVRSGAAVSVTHSTIYSNTADYTGGGISSAYAMVNLTSSTVHSNTAPFGGGIYNTYATMNLTNSTVSGNKADDDGGGLHNTWAAANLTHCTVSGNEADGFGGGIYHFMGTVNLTDTIVAEQRAGEDCYGVSAPSQGHNLDSDGTCNLGQASDISSGDADLGPLQLNAPGETATHALGPSSDALDGGDCAGGTVSEDQRGVARPQGDACDIGAYEAEVRCWATVDGSGTVHSSANSRAVRDAVHEAVGADLVKVSGYCAGVEAIEGLSATVYISKNITIKGGYDTAWTYDPAAYPTTLDAVHAGRVAVISDTNGATLDSLHIVSGTTPFCESGGGIYVAKGAAATVSHSTVYSNTADSGGGGIYLANGAAVTVTYSTILSNAANYGGGISSSDATVNLANTTVSGNKADDEGGGISAWSGTVNLTHSTVNGNEADVGGGIFKQDGALNLTNCTVSGNEAHDGVGGGIFIGRGPMNLTNSTVSGNEAVYGGDGIFNSYSTVNLRDTIVADQQAGNDCGGDAMTSQGYNLDSDGSCGLNVASNDIVNGTADLGPLQVNAPGETATHALGPNSEALDAGNCAGGKTSDDQRGVARPQGDACDIGAYEARLAFAVAKSADVSAATVGQEIQYTYRVTNTGDLTLSNVEAHDDRLGDVPLAADSLAPGAATAGTLSYTVATADLPGPLLNTVVVSGTPPVGNDVTASDDASVALTRTSHRVFLPTILKDH